MNDDQLAEAMTTIIDKVYLLGGEGGATAIFSSDEDLNEYLSFLNGVSFGLKILQAKEGQFEIVTAQGHKLETCITLTQELMHALGKLKEPI